MVTEEGNEQFFPLEMMTILIVKARTLEKESSLINSFEDKTSSSSLYFSRLTKHLEQELLSVWWPYEHFPKSSIVTCSEFRVCRCSSIETRRWQDQPLGRLKSHGKGEQGKARVGWTGVESSSLSCRLFVTRLLWFYFSV